MRPALAGRLLAWGWRCFQGETIDLNAERDSDPEAVDALIAGASYLDPDALQRGSICVVAFESARVKANRLSRTRAKAREGRFEKTTSERIEPRRSLTRSSKPASQRTKHESAQIGLQFDAPAAPPPQQPEAMVEKACSQPREIHPSSRAAVADLVEFGMLETEAMALVLKLAERVPPDSIASATIRMRGRQMLNPGRYLEKTLENEPSVCSATFPHNPPPTATQGSGEASALTPTPVRRVVSGGTVGEWTLVGWTSEQHPKSDGTREGRFKVWRTDTGKLSYKRPDEDEIPPSFGDDPGIYEVD